jgi:hypothetical protein
LMLPARRVVTFKCSRKLRDRCHRAGCKTGDSYCGLEFIGIGCP